LQFDDLRPARKVPLTSPDSGKFGLQRLARIPVKSRERRDYFIGQDVADGHGRRLGVPGFEPGNDISENAHSNVASRLTGDYEAAEDKVAILDSERVELRDRMKSWLRLHELEQWEDFRFSTSRERWKIDVRAARRIRDQ
jgi:hypothetical protein